MHKVIRLFRILFENLFINYKKYDKDFQLNTNNSLITFNVRSDHPKDNKTNWVYRRNSIIEFIKDRKPSIMCMQEVHPHMLKWLYKRIYNTYECVNALGSKRHPEMYKKVACARNGLVIWYDKSKYTLLDVDIIDVGYDSEKFVLVAKLTDGKSNYMIMNTHYHVSDKNHRERLSSLINFYLSIDNIKNNIYLCGDFNTGSNAKEIKSIELPYRIPVDGETQRTFNHFDDSWGVIDFIFSSDKIDGYEIITEGYGVKYLSDHYPILINI